MYRVARGPLSDLVALLPAAEPPPTFEELEHKPAARLPPGVAATELSPESTTPAPLIAEDERTGVRRVAVSSIAPAASPPQHPPRAS